MQKNSRSPRWGARIFAGGSWRVKVKQGLLLSDEMICITGLLLLRIECEKATWFVLQVHRTSDDRFKPRLECRGWKRSPFRACRGGSFVADEEALAGLNAEPYGADG
jgi:hypothetical protein